MFLDVTFHKQIASPFPPLTKVTAKNILFNMVNFGPLMGEICWRVWGTPANFNGFRVLAALLHGILVVGVSQTLWH